MICNLEIIAGMVNGKTILKKSFASTPLKVANITEDSRQKAVDIMLMSSSPGILDGDVYSIKITVEKHCNLNISTQSYQRLFSMKSNAGQSMHVRLEAGSAFYYLPQPCVPHKDSDFKAINRIFMETNSTLLWSEVLACGRKLNGESFEFTKYHNLTEVYMNERLVVKENLLLQPSKKNIRALGYLEDYTHQSSLLYINDKVNIQGLVSDLRDQLSQEKNVCFGVTQLPVKGLIMRVSGHKAEQLFSINKMMAKTLMKTQFQETIIYGL